MFNIDNITRKNIRELTPYSSARNEYTGSAIILLDANENPYNTDLNRYPDPYQLELKKTISDIKGVDIEQLFIGNGSDEAIDLLFRAFCEPREDKAYIFPPTYGMYKVSAKINNVEVIEIKLNENFHLPSIEVTKENLISKGLLFICSPNNPTGNSHPLSSIKEIANNFHGLVIVDEAYIDFSDSISAIRLLPDTPNLVVLQTLSKAYGLAGLRLGITYANENIIRVLNKIKPPYNINSLSQHKGIEALKNTANVENQISSIIAQRIKLMNVLKKIKSIKQVYPSEANFILAIFENPEIVFKELQNKGIIIRNRTSQIPGGLRITVGTPNQNIKLIQALKAIAS